MGFNVSVYVKDRERKAASAANASAAKPNGFSVRDYAAQRELLQSGNAEKKQQEYLSFRDTVADYVNKLSADRQAYRGKYRDKTQFNSYAALQSHAALNLLKEAYSYKDYWKENGSAYDSLSKSGTAGKDYLADTEKLIDYLNNSQEELSKEKAFRSHFNDEDSYNMAMQYTDAINTVKSGGKIPENVPAYIRDSAILAGTEKPEAYTEENFQNYLQRAKALAGLEKWTDEQRAEAEQLYNLLKPKGILNGGNLRDMWSDTMYTLTKNGEKYAPLLSTRVGTMGGDLYDDWGNIVQQLSYKTQPVKTAFNMGLRRGSGLGSLAGALDSALEKTIPKTDDADFARQFMDDSRRLGEEMEAYSQENAPIAYGAGNIGGSLATIMALGHAIEGVAGFEKLPALTKSIISGAGTMGGLQAIQGLDELVSEDTVPEKSGGLGKAGKYLYDVASSALAGASGGAWGNLWAGAGAKALGAEVSDAGIRFLENAKLGSNTLAKAVVAGLGGAGFATGSTLSKVLAGKIAEGLGYEAGDKISEGQLVQDAVVGFAFGAISNLLHSAGQSFTMREPKYKWKYFNENMSAEEAKALYHKLGFENHPDRGGSTAVMQEINAEYERFVNVVLNKASRAYSNAAKAHAAGDKKAAAAAEASFSENMLALRSCIEDVGITGAGAAEAIEVLDSVIQSGVAYETDGTDIIHVGEGAQTQLPAGAQISAEPIARQLMAAGADEASAQALAPILAEAINGQEISGNEAAKIAKNGAAVSVLENATGSKIDTDAPISDVKAAVKGLASRKESENNAPSRIYQTEKESTYKSGKSAVAEFAKTLGKAGENVFNRMYGSEQNATEYIGAMMKAYSAGKTSVAFQGIDSLSAVVTVPQLKAAYIAGQADSGRSTPNKSAEDIIAKPRNNIENQIPGKYTESRGDGYKRLSLALNNKNMVVVDGIRYTLSTPGGERYFISIDRDNAAFGGYISDARAHLYDAGPFNTRGEAIQNAVDVARSSNLIRQNAENYGSEAGTGKQRPQPGKTGNNAATPIKQHDGGLHGGGVKHSGGEAGTGQGQSFEKPKPPVKTPRDEVHGAAPKALERVPGERPTAKEHAQGASTEINAPANPQRKMADDIMRSIKRGTAFNSARLFEIADKAYGGTMAEGVYTVKDAYDGMELAVNLYLIDLEKTKQANTNDLNTVNAFVKTMQDLLSKLPTQTKRTLEQESFQQYSTPPSIAYLAAWAANITDADIVLEPSAGIGGLALWGKAWGATVYANELSKRRLAFLDQLGLDETFNLNAEQIDNLLPDNIKPTVVVMNPPFSATAGRVSTNKTANAKRHIEQALERLKDGGRLVAIVGNGMRDDAPSFKSWWNELRETYNIRANIGIDGENYKKYGTTFDIQLVVIDKIGPQNGNTVTGMYKNLSDIPKALEEVRNERQAVLRNGEERGTVRRDDDVNDRVGAAVFGPNELGDQGRVDLHPGDTSNVLPGRHGVGLHGGNRDSAVSADGGGGSTRAGVGGRTAEKGNGTALPENGGIADIPRLGGNNGGLRMALSGDAGRTAGNDRRDIRINENPDSVYATYHPSKALISGAKKHPSRLVESAAMAAVEAPDVTYTPALPAKIAEEGILSDAQLENVIYAGQAHAQKLPDGRRKGFFIGDGTGVGKGRQISGIIMDNFLQGRKKAVWISKNKDLIVDARRDWADLGGNKDDVFDASKTSLIKTGIPQKSGIAFMAYSTFRKESEKRLEMLTNWLGKDFDGVIAFDEAHIMGNCISVKQARGKSKPSGDALAGIALQKAFPNARVVYASATGATKIEQYGYLERLGLWGKGTAFNDVRDFIAKISNGGLAAMEVVARDMKAMGVYMARSISYDDVKYDTIEHKLTPMQTEIYNTMSRAWQKVLQNIDKALEITEADRRARGRAYNAFFSAQQQFYNQILASMSMPSVIADIEKELNAGRSIVIQLTGTNEAKMDRAIAKNASEGGDLDDLDLTPSEVLKDLLLKSFPTTLYEEYEDEDGNIKSRPVLDESGQPVQDKKAVRLRDALIEELGRMKVPDGPLEVLFDAFGVENVAEVTGRKRRVVRKKDENGHMKRIIEPRHPYSSNSDIDAFQSGKKRILVFSKAGGTGKSYHADLRAKNQQQRVHYLLQAGWSASDAVQGFGRTHRSNQASAPIVRLVTTNALGQKRFTSTIARRLNQLGALTKGQRQAGSGVFGEKDNLENSTAQDALSVFYKDVADPEMLKRIGLYDGLYDSNGKFNTGSPTQRNISRFLNRILALELDEQNEVFSEFYSIFSDMMDAAIANGTVDMGLENYPADKIEVLDEKVIRKDESGADTKYIQMKTYRKTKLIPYDKLRNLHADFEGLYTTDGGGVRAAYRISDKTNPKTGEVQKQYRLESPVRGKSSTFVERTMQSRTTPIEKAEWRKAWEREMANAPEYVEGTLHLLSGTLLPIWDKLPQTNTHVIRVISSDGRQYLGREIRADQIDGVLRNLGANRTRETYTGKQIMDAVLKEGKKVSLLQNKTRFVRSRVSGEQRIEIKGDNVWFYARQYVGIISEKINYVERFFIPTGERGINILNDIIRTNPVVDIESEDLLIDAENTSGTVPQEISSAKTSIKQVPALFKNKNVKFGKVNIDIGAGKYDLTTDYLKSIGTLNLVFDPYNRREAVNADTLNYLRGGYKADTATCANVLNVIKEPDARANVILEAAKAILPGGRAYFTVYEGDGSGIGKETSSGWQNNLKTHDYMDEIRKYFRSVRRQGKLITATEPKGNLPKASWEISPGKGILYSKNVSAGGIPHPEQWTAERIKEGKVESAKSLSEIIAQLRHDLGINITYGHVRGKDVRGQFSLDNKGIRSRIAQDMPTITHEIGHWLDHEFGLLDNPLPSGVGPELEEALGPLAERYSGRQIKREGFAEYVRKFLQNRDVAAIDYPETTKFVLGSLDAKSLAIFRQFADEINAYYAMDTDTATSSIRLREEGDPDFRTRTEKIADMGDAFYQAWEDSNHAIRRLDKETGGDAYIYATNAAYSDAIAAQIITGDLTDCDGQYVAPGMKTALAGVNTRDKTEWRDFGEYLVVRHGPERLEAGKRVFADDRKNNSAWMKKRRMALEAQYPAFEDAGTRLIEFEKDLTQTWGVNTGLISQGLFDSWNKTYKNHVPLNRAMPKERSSFTGVKRSYANQTSPFRRAKGSGRDIIHPAENIINEIVTFVNLGTRNNVMLKIADEAIKYGADATFLEKVPAPAARKSLDMTDVKADLSKRMKASAEAGEISADSLAGIDAVINGLNDVIYQYGRGKASGDVVTVLRDGKPEFWKINDKDLLESVTHLSGSKLNGILEAYAKTTRFMTANITGNNPIWSIFSNAPRDLGTFAVYAKQGNPITAVKAIGSAYINAFNHAYRHGANVDPLFSEYLAMGGGHASAYSADANLAKKARNSFTQPKMQRVLDAINPLNWISFISDTIEMGPRFATYKLLRTGGMTPQEAFYEAMDVTVNFRRAGYKSKQINKVVPFFNAAVQGADKFGRFFSAEDVKDNDDRAKAAGKRISAFVCASAVLALLFYILNNGDEKKKKNYQQLSNYTKNSYWCIPWPQADGKYFCIPKPRELAVVTSFFETCLEQWEGGNEHAFDEFYNYAVDNFLPSMVSDIAMLPSNIAREGANEGVKETLAGAAGSMGLLGVGFYIGANRDFLGKPIESQHMQNLEPKDRFNQNTSKIAYWGGQAFNLSPLMIDYFGNQVLGYVWKVPRALFPVGDDRRDWTLGVKSTYLKDNVYSQDLVNRLYDKKDASALAKNSDKDDMDKAITAKNDDSMTRFYSRFNSLNKDNQTSTSQRMARQTVLDMIYEYQKSVDAGSVTNSQKLVYAVIRRVGETDLMPSVMNAYIKDGDGARYNLSDAQYVEYQTSYLGYYWDLAETALAGEHSDREAQALLQQAKELARQKADEKMLKRVGVQYGSYNENYPGIDDEEYMSFKANMDIADDDGSLRQDEVIDILKSMVSEGLSNEDACTLFHSRYDSYKNNPWASYRH